MTDHISFNEPVIIPAGTFVIPIISGEYPEVIDPKIVDRDWCIKIP